MTVIRTEELTRSFARKGTRRHPLARPEQLTAVDGLTLTVEAGESVGYIGANGAGKSTTIKMLVGILVPTSGTVRTCGLEPVRQRRTLAGRVGVVFGQRSALWWDLPLRDSFELLQKMYRIPMERYRHNLERFVAHLARRNRYARVRVHCLQATWSRPGAEFLRRLAGSLGGTFHDLDALLGARAGPRKS